MASEGFEAIWRSGVGSSVILAQTAPTLVPQLELREQAPKPQPETLELVIELHPELDIELSSETEEAAVELLAESMEPASETQVEAIESAYGPQAEPTDELHACPPESLTSLVVTRH
ncbi:hypothetical protein Nepgr_031656 [Nepenthes gracilis]|uniref:Uncharacterized protein n=1 Tax=Nepenthes gracilis TaxID=150966 RepID=A0AAD3TIW5_NEPGR|nr:hypothetical protein Nepgr_031656 [Nepenthes gracilis]